ncbi:heptaprenyl diphosphate synthase component II [Thermoflavimicrobium dichotomicum]|uniref:Heptaprenyl diphosphate synthase component 2 n=1 Tax=Thermoflavimicrobium dichotomicum TaxID=46223 RepID=A0A1I3SH36_9BACL|nr:heptaprenyl diphosphate synthase component II [Thermoflavimicrobium dichotomicum]SFJ58025.1 heptaprenyl diphosphate synthase [Thermoflavimicrobium dichotomicum]
MNLQEIYKGLQNDLQLIEEELEQTVDSEVDQLQASSLHLLKAGGKRIRPVFVLLSGHFGKYDVEKLRKVAVALELIHMATLVHDDVIDNADLRRGRQTVRAQWDNRVAMYTGDYILAQALQVITQLKEPMVHQILAKAMKEMCIGEIEQIRDLYNQNQSLKRYLQRIKRKTAFLIAISCQLGALVSGASLDIVQKCYLYGYYVGMAFQMTDDVLDLVGEEKSLGKPAGSDLRQGNVTLPVIYALCHEEPANRKVIECYLQSKGESNNFEEVLELIRKSGGIDFTIGLSQRYLKKALQVLEKLPASHASQSLQFITEFIVRRSY